MQAAVSDGNRIVYFYHRILGMEFPVRLFVWLLNTLDALNNVLRVDKLTVNLRGVADQSENGGMNTVPAVDTDAVVGFEHFGKTRDLFGSR